MFKKVLAVILVLASMLSIAACGSEDNTSYIDGCIVKLGQYKDLTITISDSELEEFMVDTFKKNTTYVNTIRGTVGKNDSVVITTEVTCDGTKVDSLSVKDTIVSLGVGGNIPGFDKAVAGQSSGKPFTFTLTLPEDFEDETLAGKEVVYTATVTTIMAYPEINDSTIRDAMYATTGIFNETDFKVYCRNNLYVQKIVDQVRSTTTIDHVVQSDIDEYIQYYNEYYATAYIQQLQSGFKGDFTEYCKTYLNRTVEQLDKDIAADAQANAEFKVIMYAICEAEGMVATDAQIKTLAVNYFESYGYGTPRAFIKGEGQEYLRYTLTHQDLSSAYLFLRQNNILGASK